MVLNFAFHTRLHGRMNQSKATPLSTNVPIRDRPDVSVIIVNYNVKEFLQQALQSVAKASETVATEVFVVDNDSADGSVDMVRSSFPTVRVIANDHNAGFARANNQAIRMATGRYLLILNPDTIVSEDTLTSLVAFMDKHPDAGAAGCRILNPDGTFARESRRAFPTPSVAFFRMTGLSRLFPGSRLFGRYNLTYLPVDEIAEIDALSGSCMMVRHSAIVGFSEAHHQPMLNGQPRPAPRHFREGAGLLDEDFFMYGEDLDWCYRIQKAGWKIYYTPDTHIIHYKGASTKKSELRYVRLFYGAMIRFAEKHLDDGYPRPVLWLLHLAVVGHGALAALRTALQRLAPLLLDVALVWAVVMGLGELRAAQSGTSFPDLFYWLIAPGFALIAAIAIATLGGYRGHRRRLGPVWIGVCTSFILLAAVSFFVKEIAFSRAIVLASFPGSALVLSAVRLLRRLRRRGMGRTLFVGNAEEMARLPSVLRQREREHFELVGYVSQEDSAGATPRLGGLHHLRDLVLLRGIDDVVFGASNLSNQVIFTLMQRLRGLSARTYILPERSGAHLLFAEDILGVPRSPEARRVFDLMIAILAGVAHPIIALLARGRHERSFFRLLAERTCQWQHVIAGRRPLVGYRREDGFLPPPEWQLEPGVFAITETKGRRLRMAPQEAERAYWYYVRNQSAFLDWMIVVQSIRLMA